MLFGGGYGGMYWKLRALAAISLMFQHPPPSFPSCVLHLRQEKISSNHLRTRRQRFKACKRWRPSSMASKASALLLSARRVSSWRQEGSLGPSQAQVTFSTSRQLQACIHPTPNPLKMLRCRDDRLKHSIHFRLANHPTSKPLQLPSGEQKPSPNMFISSTSMWMDTGPLVSGSPA